ncbi:hypothetical protein Y919_10745 [Caloranaerobacter azorensis H53214]|uniref:Spore protein n=1 Tax=Caloranaerobacter azorensis H53214 TaxID=1156417 RepID=A0A096BG04_9FIRM|nr:alpha/beta-type small acid-soluble spore protein [Caloranaerobacter azorensis]KGG79648.1 hypothetical protein Y919_10745 [Caloranaerobacter azorensis H53214]
MARKNKTAPEARQALMELKLEIASELGLDKIHEREDIDPVIREVLKNGGKYAGYVGGYMVRRMIEQAERDLANRLK